MNLTLFKVKPVLAAPGVTAALALSPLAAVSAQPSRLAVSVGSSGTATPIKHLVVIF